jgi:hypothetical protein
LIGRPARRREMARWRAASDNVRKYAHFREA